MNGWSRSATPSTPNCPELPHSLTPGAQAARQAATLSLERFAIEEVNMRGGSTAPPGQKCTEKPRFFPRNDSPYGLKHEAFQTENILRPVRGRLQQPSATVADIQLSLQGLSHPTITVPGHALHAPALPPSGRGGAPVFSPSSQHRKGGHMTMPAFPVHRAETATGIISQARMKACPE